MYGARYFGKAYFGENFFGEGNDFGNDSWPFSRQGRGNRDKPIPVSNQAKGVGSAGRGHVSGQGSGVGASYQFP